jgi:tRNA pseudouridine55 synthase
MSYHGLLLVDKPKGCTSHDLVFKLRKKFKLNSVGHAGTLDPLATGLMVLLVGEATKLSDFFLNGDKSYLVQAKLGIATDTDDITGNIIDTKSVNYSEIELLKAIERLKGLLELEVPAYSAIKKNGKKLYELARQNQKIEVIKRSMNFFETKMIAKNNELLDFYLRCSKGSYVRSWVRELGKDLGSLATVNELRRVSSYPYNLDNALGWSEVLDTENFSDLMSKNAWISIDKALPHLPSFRVEPKEERLFKNGAIPHVLERVFEVEFSGAERPIKVISKKTGQLVSLVGRDEKNPYKFKIKRVFVC